jgi:hypothetical protein
MGMWDEGTTKDRLADSNCEGGKGRRVEEMRGWGRAAKDGGHCCDDPPPLPLQPPTVGI